MSAQPDLRAFFFAKSKLSSAITETIEELVGPIFGCIPVSDSDGLMQLEHLKQAALKVSGQMTGAIDNLVAFINKRFYSSSNADSVVVPLSKGTCGKPPPPNTGSIDAASATNESSTIKEEPDDDDCLILELGEPLSADLPSPASSAHSQASTHPSPVDAANLSSPVNSFKLATVQEESIQKLNIAKVTIKRSSSSSTSQKLKRIRLASTTSSADSSQDYSGGSRSSEHSTEDDMRSPPSERTSTFEAVLRYIALSYQCGIDGCTTAFAKTLLYEHRQRVHGVQVFRCPLTCKESFRSKAPLLRHMKADHNLSDRWRCSSCNYKSKNPGGLVSHYYLVHQAGKFKCTKCEVIFNSAAQVIDHYQSHFN